MCCVFGTMTMTNARKNDCCSNVETLVLRRMARSAHVARVSSAQRGVLRSRRLVAFNPTKRAPEAWAAEAQGPERREAFRHVRGPPFLIQRGGRLESEAWLRAV